MERTRLVLAGLPRMLREILGRAAEATRMDVVCVLSVADLEHTLLRWRPHAIVLGMPGSYPDAFTCALLAAEGKL